MSAVFGTWPPGSAAIVTFAAVEAALAAATGPVSFNNQDLTDVASINNVPLFFTPGVFNMGIGPLALESASTTTGGFGVAIGYNALGTVTTGFSNAAIGVNALAALTTGGDNIAIGSAAAHLATTAGANVCIGSLVAQNLTTGSQNTIVGQGGANALTTGGSNTLIGASVAPVLTTGSFNVVLGAPTGANVLTTGSRNVVIGSQAGASLVNQSNNVFVGDGAGSGVTSGSNIVIGATATSPDPTVAAQLSIGNVILGNITTSKVRVGNVTGSLSAQTDLFRTATTGADTAPVMSLQTTGANGGLAQMYVGTRDPTAAVSANAGSVYFRVSGATSGVYSNRSAADPGTTWVLM